MKLITLDFEGPPMGVKQTGKASRVEQTSLIAFQNEFFDSFFHIRVFLDEAVQTSFGRHEGSKSFNR